MFDVVHMAMRQATKEFDDDKFNAATFSKCFVRIAGIVGGLDGKIVEAMLCGRDDVKQLAGGSHYRIIEEP